MVLLELCVTFHAVNRKTLLDRYRPQLVQIISRRHRQSCLHKSEHITMTCGVPQGSIPGPLLFKLYLLFSGQTIQQHCWLQRSGRHSGLLDYDRTPDIHCRGCRDGNKLIC